MSIAAATAADKDFHAVTIDGLTKRQTNDKVTIAVDPYASGDKVKLAFNKLDPYRYGVLPVLVVIQNDSDQTLSLDRMRVVYNGPNRRQVVATAAEDVKYLRGANRPGVIPGPTGGIKVVSKKNPLNNAEIEGRAFIAKMVPPGHSASGFFYFDTAMQPGPTVYMSGIAEARTGRELLFFEVPLQ